MKKNVLLILIIIIFIITTLIISSNNNVDNDSITFGSLLPLTGSISSYGEMMQRGQMLALDEINASDNDSIKIVYFNTEHKKDIALSRLIEAKNNNIKYYVELFGSDQLEHCIDYIVDNDMYVISGVNTKPELVKMGRGHFFRIMPNDAKATAEIFNWMLDENNKNVVILYVNDDWGTGLKNSAKYNIKDLEINLLNEISINKNQTSYSSVILKVKALNPDAICLFLYPEDGGRFIKEANRLELVADFYATENFVGNDMVNIAQNSAAGVKIIIPSTPENNNKYSKMKKKYFDKYDEDPTIFAIKGYDAVYVLYDILKKMKNNNSRNFKSIIDSNYSFMGASGEISFDSMGEFNVNIYERYIFKQIDNQVKLIQYK